MPASARRRPATPSVRPAARGFIPAAASTTRSPSDGSRYADLDTALLYRKQLVAGSTCNGRDRFGLAHVDVNTDPTLRPGDIVATKGTAWWRSPA